MCLAVSSTNPIRFNISLRSSSVFQETSEQEIVIKIQQATKKYPQTQSKSTETTIYDPTQNEQKQPHESSNNTTLKY